MSRERNKKLIENGSHNFLGESGSKFATETNKKRISSGTHNLLKRKDGTSVASDRVTSGTHNWLKNKDTVSVVDKNGKVLRIPKEMFWNQKGEKSTCEYVGITSKEAEKRLNTAKENLL